MVRRSMLLLRATHLNLGEHLDLHNTQENYNAVVLREPFLSCELRHH